jgi:hypothetical protein
MKQFSSNESRLSGVFEVFFGVVSVEVFSFGLLPQECQEKNMILCKVAEVYLSNS